MLSRLRFILILLVLTGAPILVVVPKEPMLMAVGDLLVIENDLRRADLIQVLGGGPDRVEYGIELYRKGFGRLMLFTGASPARISFLRE